MENSPIMKRAEYIRAHYYLRQGPNGVWIAGNWHESRSEPGTRREVLLIEPTRENAVYEARCYWGHFNFADEAEEFFRIFSRV